MKSKKILIVAGEPSGDLHASNLVKDLKTLNQNLEFFGLGGSLSKKAGVDVIFDISKLALVGVVEVIKNIFTVGKVYKDLILRIDSTPPDLAILVDYPGFNLRLARELKKRSITTVYYISPQLWAWGKNRVHIIKKCIKKILVFFKFEEELYKKYGIDVEFVGHPLLDIVKMTSSKENILENHRLSVGKTTIALLPGSRGIEVKLLLPIMVNAAEIIGKKFGNVQFVVAKHPDLPMSSYEEEIKSSDITEHIKIRITDGDTYNILGISDFAIVASGTATLETAVIGTPFIIVYKANLLTYLLYKVVTTIPFLGLVNIIAKKEIAPELLQFDATPKKIANKVIEILGNEKERTMMREELKRVASSLGTPGAAMRAARAILPLLT